MLSATVQSTILLMWILTSIWEPTIVAAAFWVLSFLVLAGTGDHMVDWIHCFVSLFGEFGKLNLETASSGLITTVCITTSN